MNIVDARKPSLPKNHAVKVEDQGPAEASQVGDVIA